jgi:hypothetical protein
MRNHRAANGRIGWFPSHPHEGAVCVPATDPRARSVARGRSLATGREFDLVVAFERTPEEPWRAIAESSFHHLADYNWDTSNGAPRRVENPRDDPRLTAFSWTVRESGQSLAIGAFPGDPRAFVPSRPDRSLAPSLLCR